MDRNFLTTKGVTLLELAMGITVFSLLVAFSLGSLSGRKTQAKALRTTREMDILADASVQYYLKTGAWPASLVDLQPELVAAPINNNPFDYEYMFNSTGSSVTVSTFVPKGLVTQISGGPQMVVQSQETLDLISVSRPIPSGLTGRLKYDKKYLYEQ